MSSYTLAGEATAAKYRDLLAYLLRSQHSFSLVWRDELEFGPAAQQFEVALRPYELRREHANEWPGTRLLSGLAQVLTYRCSTALLGVLSGPGSLFAWRAPEWPEDLAFYDPAGGCVFGTITHERDAWVSSESLAGELRASGLVAFEADEQKA